MTAETTHEHEFSYDEHGRMRCGCGTHLFQHAPDHPYGSQPGPGGMYARWCLRDDCSWRESGLDAAGALVATFLVCVIGISLFALAVMGARHGLCQVDASHSYCHTAVAK